MAGSKTPATSMRKTIARRLSASAFTAPHIYFFSDVKMDSLLALYQDVKQAILERHGVKISVNDLLIKAVALTLEEFPHVNASFDGENIELWSEINVGLAVALDEGLIVPAIASANIATLWEIASQRADLVDRARERKLSAEEIGRGTFTISSLAQYEITHFTAIINPPQSAILSVGKTQEKVVAEDGRVVVRRVATLGLSVDHRIIDGAVAAQFLTSLKKKLERPGAHVYGAWLRQCKEAEMAAVEDLMGENRRMDYDRIPNCIYTFPEVASVGLSEAQAAGRGLKVKVGRFPYRYSGKAAAMGEEQGLVKIVSDPELGEILGACIVGRHATDLIGALILAMDMEATVDDLGEVVMGHPTLAETVKEAALDCLGRAIHKP